MLATYRAPSWLQRHKFLVYGAYLAFVLLYAAAFALIGRYFLVAFAVPIVAGIIAIIALLPVTDRDANRAMPGMLFLFVVVLCCWPDYLAISLPGVPWITLIRLVAFPLSLIVLVDLSSSATFRASVRRVLAQSKFVSVSAGIVTLLALVSIAFSSSPALSFNKLIVFLATCIIPFLAATHVFQKKERIEVFAKILLTVAIFVCLIAVQEVRHQQVPWAGRIPSFLAIQDESVQRILNGSSRAGTNVYRAQSRFGTSLGLGEFLALTLPFILHLIFTRSSFVVKAVSLASLPLIFYTVVATDSRLAAIGMLASIMLYLLAWAVVRWRTNRESMFGPAIVFGYPAIFAAFMASTFFVGRIRAMVWGDGSQAASTEARKAMYREGIPIVLKNPIGHGLGMGAQTLGFRNPAGTLTIDTYYLAIALELGVVGFICYYGIFLGIIYKSAFSLFGKLDNHTYYLIPISIALANFVLSKSVFSNLENHPLVFVMAGAAIALLAARPREPAAQR